MLHCMPTKHARRDAAQPQRLASSTLPLCPHDDIEKRRIGSPCFAIMLQPTVMPALEAPEPPSVSKDVR
jgi:hypothetical protein